MLASVRISACNPAPPVGSVAANVSTIGGVGESGIAHRLGPNGPETPRHFGKLGVYPKTEAPMATSEVTVYRTYMCLICGLIYDEEKGMPELGIAAGTRWEDLPIN